MKVHPISATPNEVEYHNSFLPKMYVCKGKTAGKTLNKQAGGSVRSLLLRRPQPGHPTTPEHMPKPTPYPNTHQNTLHSQAFSPLQLYHSRVKKVPRRMYFEVYIYPKKMFVCLFPLKTAALSLSLSMCTGEKYPF